MSTDTEVPPADEKEPPRSIEEIRAGIAAERAALGETVAALSAKLDVKARVRQRLQDTPVTVYLLGLGAAVAVGAAAWLIGRRIRS